jgi:hypothetical protein
MHRTPLVSLILVLGSVGTLFFAGACSSGGGGATSDGGTSDGPTSTTDAGDAGCQAYTSDADLTTPTVSFAGEILPVFQQSCGIAGSTCHGSPTVVGRPFLDYPDGGADAAAVLSGIVGQPSTENPQMDNVKAGDPANSFLMHKLDGDQCTLASACAKGNSPYPDCGQSMPFSSPLLDPSQRDTIRRWIAQGANNN